MGSRKVGRWEPMMGAGANIIEVTRETDTEARRKAGSRADERLPPGPVARARCPHLAHVVLAHGGDGAEHQLLAADALERLLHLAQELLKREQAAREATGPRCRQAGACDRTASVATARPPGVSPE